MISHDTGRLPSLGNLMTFATFQIAGRYFKREMVLKRYVSTIIPFFGSSFWISTVLWTNTFFGFRLVLTSLAISFEVVNVIFSEMRFSMVSNETSDEFNLI